MDIRSGCCNATKRKKTMLVRQPKFSFCSAIIQLLSILGKELKNLRWKEQIIFNRS